jgi:hypothetical protein
MLQPYWYHFIWRFFKKGLNIDGHNRFYFKIRKTNYQLWFFDMNKIGNLEKICAGEILSWCSKHIKLKPSQREGRKDHEWRLRLEGGVAGIAAKEIGGFYCSLKRIFLNIRHISYAGGSVFVIITAAPAPCIKNTVFLMLERYFTAFEKNMLW